MKTMTELKVTTVIWGLMLIAIVLLIIMITTKPRTTTQPLSVKEENPAGALMSPIGIQKQLVELGYDIKIDGKLGPETMSAWNEAYGEQCHINNMRRGGQ